MGRVISGLADCVMAAACIADLPLNLIIGIDILMFVVLVISLAAGGYLLIGHKAEKRGKRRDHSEPSLSPQERLKLYAEHCSLTPRETEVLESLLTTDEDLQGIADSCIFPVRMVQRYVSSIYEKTETKTRIGLFQSYINFTTN